MGDVLTARATCLAVLLVSVSSAWAQDSERSSTAHLRLTTEPGLTAGCARVGVVSGDSSRICGERS